MKSFRTEIENPLVAQDIIELERKIKLFKEGNINEEKFRSLRLARGVYGQRQQGVQMVRIKIPFGKLNADKLLRICDVSEKYSKGRLHITTRQDIQIHYVSLDKTPELWSELERDKVTLREACGNTIRNITASETSGIDKNEVFDPRPYAEKMFKYFLRNPICQEMGRKFKIAFSNTSKDSALAFIHDLGFIAKQKKINGIVVNGFAVLIGGGLGSQSYIAKTYTEFMPHREIISFTEAVVKVFERHGERSRRMKARLKFLIKDMGFEKFINLVEEEWKSNTFYIETHLEKEAVSIPSNIDYLDSGSFNKDAFSLWKKNNVIEQKDGNFAIGVKVKLGDIYTTQARQLAKWLVNYSGNEITLTINQNLIIRHVKKEALVFWFNSLKSIGLASLGFNQFVDITACPGTDTCNLGIANSTSLAVIVEELIDSEFPEFKNHKLINAKISGCMNSCGQHMIAAIGFQGMSIKAKDNRVLPATQILLGGSNLGNGKARIADKVIKIPSKKIPNAIRKLLNDYKYFGINSGSFIEYYIKKGKNYFYDLFKEFADLENLSNDDFIDWGQSKDYIKAIGIGECAGVVIDLISTLFLESEEKLELAKRSFENSKHKDSIYLSYQSIVNSCKALLISEEQKTNSHASIIESFHTYFIQSNLLNQSFEKYGSFEKFVLQIKNKTYSEQFAESYYNDALNFYKLVDGYRYSKIKNIAS